VKDILADLAILDLNLPWTVSKENILYKCGWSPFEGTTFQSKITHTFVNGNLVYENETSTKLNMENVYFLIDKN
jgi:dihydroorotase